jgi:hypothetical protein
MESQLLSRGLRVSGIDCLPCVGLFGLVLQTALPARLERCVEQIF